VPSEINTLGATSLPAGEAVAVAAGPAAPAAASAPAAARRPRRLLRRVAVLLVCLVLLAAGGAQLWARNQAKQLRAALADAHPDLEAIAQRYSDTVSWSLFSPDLFGVGDELLKSLTTAAGRILDSYHGDDPTTTQRGWQTAYRYLHAAAQIAPRDRHIRARMLYAHAHLDRIQSLALRGQDRRKAQEMSRQAAADFQEASRWEPDWPDPYLGLARIYAYDQFDLAALQRTLGELAKRGYKLGRRETAMLGDGFRMKGLEVEARAQRARGTDAEVGLLQEARGNLQQAVRFYGDIEGYGDAAANREEVESHLEAIAARLGQHHEPNFWERLSRALAKELHGRPGGG
jgi:hypothetical protein